MDYSKRSIFPLLITHPENKLNLENPLLGGKHPWLIKGIVNKEEIGTYVGLGKPEEEKNDNDDNDKIHLS